MEVQVIEKTIGRIDRLTGTIIRERLKVGAYCRVSTDTEDQLNSYQSQLKYYNKKINDNINWTFVDIYADEAISGTQDYKRSDFMRMIQDALDGKLDIILTKSISRFARNTLDTLKYVRMLKERNIAIIFEEENINTLEMAGELLLTILSSVAQQESETISSHVKLGLEMKMKRGELVGYNKVYGYDYDKETKEININLKEAKNVEYIFERYCFGIGCRSIARELSNMGVKTKKGKDKWHESTILGMIKNPIYKGDILLGKSYTTDAITHKRVKNCGEKNQYYIKNHHQPIISEEIWNKAQEILRKRSKVVNNGRVKGNYSRKYAFSSKIFCGYCGSVLTRRCWNSGNENEKRVWQCMRTVKESIALCKNSKGMREEVIQKAFVDAYELLCKNDKEVITNFINRVKEVTKYSGNVLKEKKLMDQIEEINKKMSVLLDLHLDGNIDEQVYLIKKETLNAEKEKMQKKLNELSVERRDEKSAEKGLEKIEEIFNNSIIMPEFDEDVFETLVRNIIIGEGEDPMTIIFILKNGSEFSKTMEEVHDEIKENITYKKEDVILDFFSNQRIINFEKYGVGKRKKIIDKIRVKVVYETESMI